MRGLRIRCDSSDRTRRPPGCVRLPACTIARSSLAPVSVPMFLTGQAVAVGVGRAVGVCAAAATDVDPAASAVDSAAIGRLVVSAVGEGAGGLVAATLAVTVGVGSGPVTGDAGSVDECALALGVPVPPGGRVGLATRALRVGCVVAVDPVTGSLGVGSWLADGVGAAVASARAAPAARRASATRAVILVRICSCWASESAGVDGGATGVSVLLDHHPVQAHRGRQGVPLRDLPGAACA